MRRKKGVVNHHPFNKTSFLNFFYARCRPPHPRLAPYTPEVETPAPQRTRNGCTRQAAEQTMHRHTRPDAGHAAPACALYQTAHARQIVTVRDAGGRAVCPKLCRFGQHNFAILCQKNKSEKSYIFAQKVLTYKIYLI